MKNYLTLLLCMFSVVFFSSCEEGSPGSLSSGLPAEVLEDGKITAEEIEEIQKGEEEKDDEKVSDSIANVEEEENKESIETGDENITELEKDSEPQDDTSLDNIKESFTFDHLSGKCTNTSGVEGYNKGELVSCGDMSAQNIEKLKTKKSNLYGIVLEDTYISNSKVRISDLVIYEAVLNEGTKIDSLRNPLYKLYKGHSRKYKKSGITISKYQKKYAKQKSRIKSLISNYKKSSKEKKKARLEKSLIKAKEKLEKLAVIIKTLGQRKHRFKKFSKEYGRIAEK